MLTKKLQSRGLVRRDWAVFVMWLLTMAMAYVLGSVGLSDLYDSYNGIDDIVASLLVRGHHLVAVPSGYCSEVDANRRDSLDKDSVGTIRVILLNALDLQVDVVLIVGVALAQLAQLRLHCFLLFLGLMSSTHDGKHVERRCALENVADLQTWVSLLNMSKEVGKGHLCGIFNLPTIPEAHFDTFDELSFG